MQERKCNSNLCHFLVSDAVATKHPLFSLDGNTTVGAALDILEHRGFAAIGVHCLASTAQDANPSLVNRSCRPPIAYLGILSITDILSFINRKEDRGWDTPISELIDISPESSTCATVSVRDSVADCLSLFSTGKTYHAIASCSKEGKFWMLAQSDLIACLLDREPLFAHLTGVFNTPIGEVSSVTTTFLCPDSSVDEAIEKALTRHGVPVIDKRTGLILETLSVSDFTGRARMAYVLASRLQSVAEFLLNCKGDESIQPISLSSESTVREAARTMIINGVHRVWIQPPEKGPLPQVISMTDVLSLVLQG